MPVGVSPLPFPMDPPSRKASLAVNKNRFKETRFGDYVLGQTLGEGEFGKVKLGWMKTGGEQVCISFAMGDL